MKNNAQWQLTFAMIQSERFRTALETIKSLDYHQAVEMRRIAIVALNTNQKFMEAALKSSEKE